MIFQWLKLAYKTYVRKQNGPFFFFFLIEEIEGLILESDNLRKGL